MTADDHLDVLLVEDNPGDARLAREAFAATDRNVHLTVASDGQEALDVITERHADGDSPPPSLVLLDLDLPGVDGRTVLRELKSDPTLMRIPVVVFSGSEDDADVERMYDFHANAYVTKPRDATGYFDTIERLSAFWFSAVTLPSIEEA
jgi:chemotaxis family two-component system response regulator Rcp1